MTSPPPILDSFVERLAVRDFEGLAACLDPDVRLRAIIPPGPEEHHGRAAAVGRSGDWFADAVSFELVEHRIELFVDRWLVTYRIALDEGTVRAASSSTCSATWAPSCSNASTCSARAFARWCFRRRPVFIASTPERSAARMGLAGARPPVSPPNG